MVVPVFHATPWCPSCSSDWSTAPESSCRPEDVDLDLECVYIRTYWMVNTVYYTIPFHTISTCMEVSCAVR